jgi:hypothetical protein
MVHEETAEDQTLKKTGPFGCAASPRSRQRHVPSLRNLTLAFCTAWLHQVKRALLSPLKRLSTQLITRHTTARRQTPSRFTHISPDNPDSTYTMVRLPNSRASSTLPNGPIHFPNNHHHPPKTNAPPSRPTPPSLPPQAAQPLAPLLPNLPEALRLPSAAAQPPTAPTKSPMLAPQALAPQAQVAAARLC